jgi:hypothetical protein
VLSIFRTNQLIVNILLIFYAAILLSATLLSERVWQAGPQGIAFHWLTQFFQGSAMIAWITGLVAVVLGAFLVNYLDLAFRLSREINMIPGLVYVLFCSSIPDAGFASPIHFANLFLLLALYEVMDTFKRASVADRVFNAGFFLALAGLFYPAYLVFIFLLFRGLNMLRGYSIRERLMMLVGVLVPYFLVGVGSFMLDQYDVFWRLQVSEAYAWLDLRSEKWHLGGALLLLVWGIAILVALYKQNSFQQKRVIQAQRRIDLLYWALLLALLTLPIQKQLGLDQMLCIAAPLAFLSGMHLQEMRRGLSEFLHLIWMALVLIVQYRDFIFPG